MLNSGARVNEGRGEEGTPLHIAAWNGSIRAAHALIESGADIGALDIREQTPLHHVHGSPAIVKLLMQNGAEINATDSSGRTALHCAADNAYHGTETFQELVHNGFDASLRDSRGKTPTDILSDFPNLPW